MSTIRFQPEHRFVLGSIVVGEGAKLFAPHASATTFVTSEQFFAVDSQFALWPDEPVQRLPCNPEFGIKSMPEEPPRYWLAQVYLGLTCKPEEMRGDGKHP